MDTPRGDGEKPQMTHVILSELRIRLNNDLKTLYDTKREKDPMIFFSRAIYFITCIGINLDVALEDVEIPQLSKTHTDFLETHWNKLVRECAIIEESALEALATHSELEYKQILETLVDRHITQVVIFGIFNRALKKK